MPQSFRLHSPETGTEYLIFVEAPPRKGPRGWPVAIFLDGDNQFEYAVREYKTLRAAGKVPATLLVGVGYGAGYSKGQNKRGRDYTPTANPDEPTSGGAANFAKFLEHTLWPELEKLYPVSGDKKTVGGYSLSALFVLYALFLPKRFFSRHLACSPSIWWDHRAVLKQAQAFRKRHPELDAELFLSVGEKDSTSMTGDLAMLEGELTRQPFKKLQLITRRFPDRHHFNALPDSFRSGMLELWGK